MSFLSGDKGAEPTHQFDGFKHVELWVGNAKQAAGWYCSRLGFSPYAYKGLETGSRDLVTHVVRQNKIMIAFTSQLQPDVNHEIAQHIGQHGDGVKDIAFGVKTENDLNILYKKVQDRGCKITKELSEQSDDNGSIKSFTVQTYGDTTHTIIFDGSYDKQKGFLPGFKLVDSADPINALLPVVGVQFIDHCVGNQPDQGMEPAVQWYEKFFEFHRYWSVDDKQIHTKYSSLRSIVMCDFSELIKMPINEPADGLRKSQIQEYVEWYGGAGVQHIALNTPDVVTAVNALKARGVEFLTIPKTYYTNLRERLANSPVDVKEDLDIIEKLNILIDFDDQGYLLQIFTKPVEDRPTLFFEIIQRMNHQGFGAGNFKSLFESIEIEQGKRGNL